MSRNFGEKQPPPPRQQISTIIAGVFVMAYVVWRVLMKKYSKVRLGLQKGPSTCPQSTTNIVSVLKYNFSISRIVGSGFLCVFFFCFSFHTNKKKCSILRDLLFTLMWTRFVIDKMHSRLALKSQALDLLIFNMILYTIHLCSTCESLSPWNTISWFCQYHRYGFLCVNRSGVFFLCFVLFCFVFSCVCNLFYLQKSITIAITLVQIFSYTERIKAINLQWVERTFSEWFN